MTEEYTVVQLKRQEELTRRIQEKLTQAAGRINGTEAGPGLGLQLSGSYGNGELKRGNMNPSEPSIVKLLELAALNYNEVFRHPRKLDQRRASLKHELLDLMKRYGREVYEYNGIKIRANRGETVEVEIDPAKRTKENPGPAWISAKVSA